MTKKKSKIRIGDVKGDVTISQDQSGGTTAHETGTATDKKTSKSKRRIVEGIVVTAAILAILAYFDIKPSKENKMPKDEEEKISIGDVNGDVVISQDQTGGITAGKIEQINIFTDKESLGIREKFGLYRDGKKVGDVINPDIDETNNTFSFAEIQFDKPIRDQNFLSTPFEFRNYIIQIKNCREVVFLLPPGAKGVSGVILNKK